jgi:single-stranded-DNA-specific exonuclease
MREWVEPQELVVPEELLAAIGGHRLVVTTLARRGFTDVEEARAFLDPDSYGPAPATDLPGLVEAVERLERAIRDRKKICVWGDFDVDGQTATTLLFCTLRDLGADVQYHIPVRATESHGINIPVLSSVIGEGVRVVLTCDTGVSAHEAVEYAHERDVEVIVTDHHDLPPALPEADAVVNPKMLPEGHPLRQLPGVGCAYKLAEGLYQSAGRMGDVAQYLDLVALGIVADVAMQTRDTRYLLQRGLEALRRTERLGLRVMVELAEVNSQWLTEEHVGFILAPRLNALGRLADANVAVEFLTTDGLGQARILATELEGLNARRKLLSDQVFQAAVAQIEREASLLEQRALVLSNPAWPAGVIGIVASRLVERYGRPTVLIASPPGKLARGSARSIEGCNITAAIAAHGEMLSSFGGHPMAAGISLDPERIPEFGRALSRTVAEMLGDVEQAPSLEIAAFMPLAALSLELVEELERLAPFGPGNPSLTLATKGLDLTSQSAVGRHGEHLQLIVQDEEGTQAKVIWWQADQSSLPEGRFDLAYVVRASDYRGQREVQMEWADARVVEAPRVVLPVELPPLEVVDYRQAVDVRRIVEELRRVEDLAIWSEAQHRKEVGGQDRYELGRARALGIYTAPPGPSELQGVLDTVVPERVYLFARDPNLDDIQRFLERLAGLVKHRLSSFAGRVTISLLAAATAQRESTVQVGVAWLGAKGQIIVVGQKGDELEFAAADKTMRPDALALEEVAVPLKGALEETAAYREHFKRASPEALFGQRRHVV